MDQRGRTRAKGGLPSGAALPARAHRRSSRPPADEMGRGGGVPRGRGDDCDRHRSPDHEARIERKALRGRLVELRPEDNVEPSFSRVAWWLWRLEDMKWIGHCGVRRAEGSVYTAGLSIWRSRGRYTGS